VYKLETIGDCYVASVGVVTGKTLRKGIGAAATAAGDAADVASPHEDRVGDTAATNTTDVASVGLKSITFSKAALVVEASRRNTRDMVSFAKRMISVATSVRKPVQVSDDANQ